MTKLGTWRFWRCPKFRVGFIRTKQRHLLHIRIGYLRITRDKNTIATG